MIFVAHGSDWLDLGERRARCALGPAGVKPAAEKREGDGATPAGDWPLRCVFWRPDRRAAPLTALPGRALTPADGWCDAPDDPAYNRPVRLPYPASAERLWRDDALYDLMVVLGHNDDPPALGLGSAIFLHQAGRDFAPTEGCIALAPPDLEALVARARLGDVLRVSAEAPP
ncbi:MAG: L,D-transpeptidase family protein [Caulobacteraceae bacterium]